MPLIATLAVAPEPTPTPPPVIPVARPLGLTYVDPDGAEWPLSDRSSGVVALALAGISGPQPSLSSVSLPGGGGLPLSYQSAQRTITLGIFLEAADQDSFLTLQDRWARALWCERAGAVAPGTLIVQRPDGSARQIPVIHVDGGDQSDDDRTKSGLTWSSYVLTLQATDPWWSDVEVGEAIEFKPPSASAGILPLLPVELLPSLAMGSATVVNSGDADAWPLWQITGPGTPTLENVTTGRSWGLASALTAGETVTVLTGPFGHQYATDQLGANRWPDLVQSSPRDLWPLVPGTNELNLTLSGADADLGSLISMTYTRRWLRS